MSDQAVFILKRCHFHLHNITAVRTSLTKAWTEKLIHARISSRLDFCDSLLTGLPSSQIYKLQKIQNAIATILTKTPRRNHMHPVLKALHCLPITYRNDLKILTLPHNGLKVQLLQDFLSLHAPSHSTRSKDQFLLHQPNARMRR